MILMAAQVSAGGGEAGVREQRRLPVAEMQAAAEAMDFERAVVLRDRLKALTFIQGTQFINAEGIGDASGPLWLHAFPRVLGYAFKPVSFWFCHRVDGPLRAIVCEITWAPALIVPACP